MYEEALRQVVGNFMGEALAVPEHRGEALAESRGLAMEQTTVVDFCEVERLQRLEQRPGIVERPEVQSGFELVNLAAEQGELEANRRPSMPKTSS